MNIIGCQVNSSKHYKSHVVFDGIHDIESSEDNVYTDNRLIGGFNSK